MSKNKETLTITIDKQISKKLEEYNKLTMVSRSALVNKLLNDFFEKNEKK